uniref:SCP domain-containing protein n=1 Tax=Sander lucioperca TaxID=283035 RepID=A0A8D0AJU4_SANLU
IGKDANFQREFLETHNAYRLKHNTPKMTLSSELSASAQKWANHLLAIGALQHSKPEDRKNIGENIYNMWSSATLKLTGHFTQVVWKDSKELGVGMATDGHKVFVVGQYRPAGNMNMAGYFEKNVLPKDYITPKTSGGK